MLINLPDNIADAARDKAIAAGFGDQIEAFIVHLVTAHQPEDLGAPDEVKLSGRNQADFKAMIEAGYASGEATPMTDEDWGKLESQFNTSLD